MAMLEEHEMAENTFPHCKFNSARQLKPRADTSTHIHTDTFDAMYCQQVKDGLNFTKLSNP